MGSLIMDKRGDNSELQDSNEDEYDEDKEGAGSERDNKSFLNEGSSQDKEEKSQKNNTQG